MVAAHWHTAMGQGGRGGLHSTGRQSQEVLSTSHICELSKLSQWIKERGKEVSLGEVVLGGVSAGEGGRGTESTDISTSWDRWAALSRDLGLPHFHNVHFKVLPLSKLLFVVVHT